MERIYSWGGRSLAIYLSWCQNYVKKNNYLAKSCTGGGGWSAAPTALPFCCPYAKREIKMLPKIGFENYVSITCIALLENKRKFIKKYIAKKLCATPTMWRRLRYAVGIVKYILTQLQGHISSIIYLFYLFILYFI